MVLIEPVEYKPRAEAIPEKASVLKYMQEGHRAAYSPMYYKDRETGEFADEACFMHDGVYGWTTDTIYHFERYNYPLPDDFIRHVLSRLEDEKETP